MAASVRRVVALAAAAASLAACATPSPEIAAAAERGRAEARYDIEHRRPRRAFVGLELDERSALDPATGLVRFSVGCCKSYERLALCDAYNDAIDRALRDGAFAGATLEKKATDREALAVRFAKASPVTLTPGGPPADAPGGRFRVSAGRGEGRDATALFATDTTTAERTELRFLAGDAVRVAFLDDGTTLAVRDDAARLYATFDLPTALALQVFPDARRE